MDKSFRIQVHCMPSFDVHSIVSITRQLRVRTATRRSRNNPTRPSFPLGGGVNFSNGDHGNPTAVGCLAPRRYCLRRRIGPLIEELRNKRRFTVPGTQLIWVRMCFVSAKVHCFRMLATRVLRARRYSPATSQPSKQEVRLIT